MRVLNSELTKKKKLSTTRFSVMLILTPRSHAHGLLRARTHAHTHDVAHGGGGEGGECEEEMIEVQLARGYESEFARCDDKFVKKKNILEILIVTSWLYLEMLDFVRIRNYGLVSKRQ